MPQMRGTLKIIAFVLDLSACVYAQAEREEIICSIQNYCRNYLF